MQGRFPGDVPDQLGTHQLETVGEVVNPGPEEDTEELLESPIEPSLVGTIANETPTGEPAGTDDETDVAPRHLSDHPRNGLQFHLAVGVHAQDDVSLDARIPLPERPADSGVLLLLQDLNRRICASKLLANVPRGLWRPGRDHNDNLE